MDQLNTLLMTFQSDLEGGIDARSPDGTAASFSKANKNAILLGNSSHFYEYVSSELLNSLQR